jgi:hypothetical protein
MVEQELTLKEIVQRLPSATDAAHVPAADLWPRIAAAHVARQRRRRVQRSVAATLALAATFAAVLLVPAWLTKPAANVDWQARAQALEIQLSALSVPANFDNTVVEDAELARIDGALQAAYDRGAPANELVPLWKKRSELLSALLIARQQQVALTRI